MIAIDFLIFIDFLEKKRLPITIAVIVFAFILMCYMPVHFGIMLIALSLIFLIATFNPKQIKKSFTRLCILLFILGLFFSPIIVSLGQETYKFHNPDTIIDLDHQEILKLTEEFKENYKDGSEDAETILSEVKTFVYERIPYEYGHLYIFPTTQDVIDGKNSDCRGRAIVGFSILKNLGYDAHILYGLVDGPHAWIRVLKEDGTHVDGFLMKDNRPNFEPFVIFNEHESTFNSPMKQMYGILFHGFYHPNFSNLMKSASMIFMLPITIVAIYLLLIHWIDKMLIYLFVLITGLILTYDLGNLFIENHISNILPIILLVVTIGFYLRIINFISFKISKNLNHTKFIQQRVT
ncbi:MAG: hypothetical protein JSW62_00520 [Thermoplasmatales archaeon]|nr:MAG: hypothetical protein JSW62_00520 [Thermoplasmatales archaeon]